MPENDTQRMKLQDIGEAIGLLTRLPINSAPDRGVQAAWAWPLAGGVVAILAGLIAWIALGLGMSAELSAAAALVTLVVVTGAMHEDGLADCADGFWGGWEPTGRLEIMKDSRIGTYGVVALVLSLLWRWTAMVALIKAGWLFGPLIVAALMSRVAPVALMHGLENARSGGLSDKVGRPEIESVILSSVIALLGGLLLVGFSAVVMAAAVALGCVGVARLSLNKIGGQTGDVLGASQQVTEIIALSAMVALLT